jgi:hypothetical protein
MGRYPEVLIRIFTFKNTLSRTELTHHQTPYFILYRSCFRYDYTVKKIEGAVQIVRGLTVVKRKNRIRLLLVKFIFCRVLVFQ